MKTRILAINPECQVVTYSEKIDGERFMEIYLKEGPAIVCDAIDMFI